MAVSPDGYALISKGMNALNLTIADPVMQTFRAKYQSPDQWMDETIPFLKEYGYNGAGSWCDTDLVRSYNERNDDHFSYCTMLYLLTNYKQTLDESTGYHADKKLMPVFDKGFETYCAVRAAGLEAMKDDPNLFGHFLDNELTFSRDLLDLYLSLPEKEQGYTATLDWLKAKGLGSDSPLTDSLRDEFRVHVLNR